MTDRAKGFVVTLEHDVRVDDAKALQDAIAQLRGVVSVRPVLGNVDDHINRERVRLDLEQKLWSALRPADADKRGGR